MFLDNNNQLLHVEGKCFMEVGKRVIRFDIKSELSC